MLLCFKLEMLAHTEELLILMNVVELKMTGSSARNESARARVARETGRMSTFCE